MFNAVFSNLDSRSWDIAIGSVSTEGRFLRESWSESVKKHFQRLLGESLGPHWIRNEVPQETGRASRAQLVQQRMACRQLMKFLKERGTRQRTWSAFIHASSHLVSEGNQAKQRTRRDKKKWGAKLKKRAYYDLFYGSAEGKQLS